jgi:hypothetical protein
VPETPVNAKNRRTSRPACAGVEPVSSRLRFGTVATWWLERFEAKVAAGERPRTLEAHRYQLEHYLLPAMAARRINMITVDDIASRADKSLPIPIRRVRDGR